MRHQRTALEAMVGEVMAESASELTPGLRDAIRQALDRGVTPAQVRARFGSQSPLYRRYPATALSVDWMVDQWERDRGRVQAGQSIDHVE